MGYWFVHLSAGESRALNAVLLQEAPVQGVRLAVLQRLFVSAFPARREKTDKLKLHWNWVFLSILVNKQNGIHIPLPCGP